MDSTVEAWSLTIARPPRTDAHATRDALLQQFKDAGLQATISTNGSIPDADIQQSVGLLKEGGKYGEVVDVSLTERGQARLDAKRDESRVITIRGNGSVTISLPAPPPGAWEQPK